MRAVKAPPGSRSIRESSNYFRCVGLNEVVVWRGLCAPRAPEHRLAIVGIGLGVVVAEQFALTGIHQRDLRRQGQFEARLVEGFARLHHLGAEPDRFVTRPWIRQTGRKVRRVKHVAVARGGVDQDVDLGPGRTERKGSLVGPGQAERCEDGEDIGFRFNDGDGPQEARAERAFERVDAPRFSRSAKTVRMHTIWRADHPARDAAAAKSALYPKCGVSKVPDRSCRSEDSRPTSAHPPVPCGRAFASPASRKFKVVRASSVILLLCALKFAPEAMGWSRFSRPFVLPKSGNWWRAPSTESFACVGSSGAWRTEWPWLSLRLPLKK